MRETSESLSISSSVLLVQKAVVGLSLALGLSFIAASFVQKNLETNLKTVELRFESLSWLQNLSRLNVQSLERPAPVAFMKKTAVIPKAKSKGRIIFFGKKKKPEPPTVLFSAQWVISEKDPSPLKRNLLNEEATHHIGSAHRKLNEEFSFALNTHHFKRVPQKKVSIQNEVKPISEEKAVSTQPLGQAVIPKTEVVAEEKEKVEAAEEVIYQDVDVLEELNASLSFLHAKKDLVVINEIESALPLSAVVSSQPTQPSSQPIVEKKENKPVEKKETVPSSQVKTKPVLAAKADVPKISEAFKTPTKVAPPVKQVVKEIPKTLPVPTLNVKPTVKSVKPVVAAPLVVKKETPLPIPVKRLPELAEWKVAPIPVSPPKVEPLPVVELKPLHLSSPKPLDPVNTQVISRSGDNNHLEPDFIEFEVSHPEPALNTQEPEASPEKSETAQGVVMNTVNTQKPDSKVVSIQMPSQATPAVTSETATPTPKQTLPLKKQESALTNESATPVSPTSKWVEAFHWQNSPQGEPTYSSLDEKEVSTDLFSLEGAAADAVEGWVLVARPDNHWKTLHGFYDKQDGFSLPVVKDATLLALYGLYRQTYPNESVSIEDTTGVIFGTLAPGWRVELSGRASRILLISQDRKILTQDDSSQWRSFVYFNVAPVYHRLQLEEVKTGRRAVVEPPVVPGVATYIETRKVEVIKSISGWTSEVIDEQEAHGAMGVQVSVLEQPLTTVHSDQQGHFEIRGAVAVGSYPIVLDTQGPQGDVHRYRFNRHESLKDIVLARMSEGAPDSQDALGQIPRWLLDLGSQLRDGIIVGAVPKILKKFRKNSMQLYPKLVRFDEPSGKNEHLIHSASASGQLSDKLPLETQGRFFVPDAPEGMVQLKLVDVADQVVFSKLLFVQPYQPESQEFKKRVIEVVGPY